MALGEYFTAMDGVIGDLERMWKGYTEGRGGAREAGVRDLVSLLSHCRPLGLTVSPSWWKWDSVASYSCSSNSLRMAPEDYSIPSNSYILVSPALLTWAECLTVRRTDSSQLLPTVAHTIPAC